jgi:hypothetical protein
MHEHSFPESDESAEARSQRAVAALEYEERAQLGFRKRLHGMGDPWRNPDRHQIDRDATRGELLAGYCGGAAIVLGAGAVFYKPLMLATLAIILGTCGAMSSSRQAAHLGKLGLIFACAGFTIGMLFSILVERPIF